MTSLAHTQSLSKHFGGVIALDGFSCRVMEDEILGLLGPNGAGKTTFFNILTGLLAPDDGTADFKGSALIGRSLNEIANLGIARTFQDLRLIRNITVLENVLFHFKKHPGENLLNVFFRPGYCRRHEADISQKGRELLRKVGFLAMADDLAGNLSFGQQKLLSLVCCLAADADLLLLDEPVAGIAPEIAERVLQVIAGLPEQGKSAIVIEHDIDALKVIAHRMIFMDAGRVVCEGVPEVVLNDPRVIEAYLE